MGALPPTSTRADGIPAERAALWALPELIEAASRTGQTQLAADALARLAEATSISQTDWGPGIYARCRALLSDGQHAERSPRPGSDRAGRVRSNSRQ